jgi:hypothetical protein
MHAYFDAQDGNPKVVLEISGTDKKIIKTIPALLDTGHSGSLSLPTLDLIEIGAKLSGVGEVEYASGHTGTVLYFTVTVSVDGKKKEVEAGMIENPKATEAIAGLELFAPYVALIDFKNKAIKFYDEEATKKFLEA